MLLAFKLAWRNIWKHKGKSLVIGVILFIGALLMTTGNGLLSGMEEGLAENIVNLFTGDILLISAEQDNDNVLMDMMNGKPIKVIKNFDEVKNLLEKEESIEDFLPSTAGMVFILDSGADMGTMMLLGVDIERYQKMFPDSFSVIEGKNLKPGERGILVPQYARESLYDFVNYWLLPEGEELNKDNLTADARKYLDSLELRTDIVFMGASTSNSTLDIRVPVKGVIKYKALNGIWGYYCIVDIESFREAHNYVTGADSTVELGEEERQLLESENLDEFFSSGELFEDTSLTGERLTIEEIQSETIREVTEYNPDAGSYNLVHIKIKEGLSRARIMAQLNSLFEENNMSVRAVSWKSAIGTIGSMAVMIKAALNIFVMFIFFVAIIIIMNTLSMAALERVSEIAMMRAVGAQKGFLRRMFIFETGILSFFFGGLGIITGIAVIYLLQAADITTTNEILQMVYGGDKLNPVFTFPDLLIGVLELGIVTLLSVIYPLRVVGKIVPLDAIVRE